MKRLLVGIVLCIAAYGIVIAGDNESHNTLTNAKVERIEKDLINAFGSNIPGLQTSAATTLLQVHNVVPEYGWSNSIIPLMHIVNDENAHPDARIAAALALYDLGSARGDYAIVQNARFASNDRVKRFCSLLVANRHLETNTP